MKRTFCKLSGILVIGAISSPQSVHAQSTAEVTTVGVSFSPADVQISVGDSVHWTGLPGHTVAEVNDGSATTWNGGFHSAGGASEFTHIFITPGTFHYICEPHVFAGMRGTVTVLAPEFGCCWTCDGSALTCAGPIIQDDCPPTYSWIQDASCGTEVCGTDQCVAPPVCGDDVVNQVSEDCDGTDDAACPGQCRLDCTCPPPAICGDSVLNQPSEDCDGTDAAACPGQCRIDCTCPPPAICGDNVVNQPSEDCDGTDDAACPGQCRPNCSCQPVGDIPTVSEWGIAVLALLLLVGGRVYFRRRRTIQV